MKKINQIPLDTHGRSVRYLRLSVTDRCNLRCTYCRSYDDTQCITHESVLRYEEMCRIVRVTTDMGITKVRLTGGEPFARKGFISFVEMLHKNHPNLDVRMTTNGTLVRPHVQALRDLSVHTLNISLDSFVPETFARITGQDLLHEVRATMDALMQAGIAIKLNAVALRGVTDTEMQSFVEFVMQYPVDIRFIEFMPMGSQTSWDTATFLPASELLEIAGRYANISPYTPHTEKEKSEGALAGPAAMYGLEGGRGRLGFITAMSNHFCNVCNRIRVTSDGFLRTCLFADKEYNVRNILRNPKLQGRAAEEHIKKIIEEAVKIKPLGEELLKARRSVAVAQKKMVSIGG